MNKFKPTVYALLALLLQYFAVQYIISNEWLLSSMIGVSRRLAYFVAKFTQILSFSLGDIFYAGILLFLGSLVLNVIRHKSKAIYKTLYRFFIFLNAAFFLFYLSFGFNYYAPKIPRTAAKNIQNSKLKSLAKLYLNTSKSLRVKMNIKENMDLQGKYSNVKPSLYSPIISYLGIAGYYNPFTAEAQYNTCIPAAKIPFAIQHELAHQKGYAREEEANFVGFKDALKSRNLYFRYSANYKALRSILNALPTTDSVFFDSIVNSYTRGMENDRQESIAYHKKYTGWASKNFRKANDAYLKANNQKGVASYADFVRLLYYYHFGG